MVPPAAVLHHGGLGVPATTIIMWFELRLGGIQGQGKSTGEDLAFLTPSNLLDPTDETNSSSDYCRVECRQGNLPTRDLHTVA